MYIKSITIDGFKSYGQKTTVDGFDRTFNAITGLNGSGKSNILDSICFLLGISNMSLVRVNNLRELIYKNGQTGVTKATVTIVFNNMDKQQSPTGYENDDEIVIRKEINTHNQSKYYINGDKKLTSQVADFFHSVQLNVNNPHFLIMQGRITKVINMKPKEVFGMIEEATNISMYENKKRDTQNTIEKKNGDLKHIDNLLNENIIPKLNELKKEQSNLAEFQRLSLQLQHTEKLYTAWRYLDFEKLCESSGAQVGALQESIDKINEEEQNSSEQIVELSKQIQEMELKKDKESGNVLGQLEVELKDTQLKEAKIVSLVNVKKDNKKEENRRINQIQKNLNEEVKIRKQKETECAMLKASSEQLKKDYEQSQERLKQALKNLEAISVGLSCDNGEVAGTLIDQLKIAEIEYNKNKTETSKIRNEISHIEKEIKRLETELAKARKGHERGDITIEDVEKKVEKSLQHLQQLNFNPEHIENVASERETKLSELYSKKESTKRMEMENPSLIFKYRQPPNFDSNKVFGVIANLFKAKNPEHSTALEKVAGGRLFNVVVDTDETAKLIFNHGQLERRCTLLPMNVIQGRDVDTTALRNAEKLVGKDNVFAAINLIEFDPKLKEAMKYVFGDTLICTNMDVAKKVTFAENVSKRSVTLDGEVFDPSGTISGGSSGKGGHILAQAACIQQGKEKIRELEVGLRKLDSELEVLREVSKTYRPIKAQYDKDMHELELVRIKYTIENQLVEQLKELRSQKAAKEKEIIQSGESNVALEQKMKDLRFKIDNSKVSREKELEDAKERLAQAKKDVNNSKGYEDIDKKVNSLQLEIDELDKNISVYESQIKEIQSSISNIDQEIGDESEILANANEEVKKVMDRIKEQKNILKQQCSEINKLQKQKDLLNKRLEDNKIKLKKIAHEIEQIETKSKDASTSIKSLLKANPWIETEKELFQKSSYGIDENFDGRATYEKIQKMKSSINQLSKTVNLRASIMLRDTETEIEDLRRKRNILETDKQKLLDYIAQVDKKKQITLETAYKKINKDFGDIFSTLLPGTKAKLEQLEGKTIFDGLRIRIAFGDIWKESLNELSGGQRSLVALSLIFALLLYKPAPIYILDEVDAALDNSHTQNIGIMIKKHFARSQFIIVSLKDDMFNNANVLFRTKFVNGTSTVARLSKN